MLKKDGFGCKCRVIKKVSLNRAYNIYGALGGVGSICKGVVPAQQLPARVA